MKKHARYHVNRKLSEYDRAPAKPSGTASSQDGKGGTVTGERGDSHRVTPPVSRLFRPKRQNRHEPIYRNSYAVALWVHRSSSMLRNSRWIGDWFLRRAAGQLTAPGYKTIRS